MVRGVRQPLRLSKIDFKAHLSHDSNTKRMVIPIFRVFRLESKFL